MNKDNYIRLLEKENQEYFEKAMKTMKDCCCHEIPELNDEINELLDDLNDFQADWAADHAEYRKTLEVIKEQNTRECDLNVRLQGIIKELTGKLDTADAGLRQVPMLREQVNEFVKKNENLQEDLETSRKRIAALEADKNGHRSIAKELKKEKYDMGVELEKLKKENTDLLLEVFRLNPPIPTPVMEDRTQ